ncbi:UPF0434 protein BRADO0313 isoform X1 [Hippoglossus stenolepis]|uniref:UPF0434 protein BRADO0313 isoform X1 n=1 Tax=Hippoglossus stenolepis TaxID=195615 RepID=UPI001FAFF275|nr:UPF0434 protein BRADO0313 isoform X1 [Hippoglossus stenolepis]
MFPQVLCKVVLQSVVVGRCVTRAAVTHTRTHTPALLVRCFTDRKEEVGPKIDEALLQVLVCPLSKKQLRYDAETNELINEELGIAYPILDGIPNMIPTEARLLQKDASTAE